MADDLYVAIESSNPIWHVAEADSHEVICGANIPKDAKIDTVPRINPASFQKRYEVCAECDPPVAADAMMNRLRMSRNRKHRQILDRQRYRTTWSKPLRDIDATSATGEWRSRRTWKAVRHCWKHGDWPITASGCRSWTSLRFRTGPRNR